MLPTTVAAATTNKLYGTTSIFPTVCGIVAWSTSNDDASAYGTHAVNCTDNTVGACNFSAHNATASADLNLCVMLWAG